jgi:hypothetical protein
LFLGLLSITDIADGFYGADTVAPIISSLLIPVISSVA